MFVETESLGMFTLVSIKVCTSSFSIGLCTPSDFVTAFFDITAFSFVWVPKAGFKFLESNVSGELGISDEDWFLEILRSLNLRTFR